MMTPSSASFHSESDGLLEGREALSTGCREGKAEGKRVSERRREGGRKRVSGRGREESDWKGRERDGRGKQREKYVRGKERQWEFRREGDGEKEER